MKNIEEQIFAYPHLAQEEKQAVEAYVEKHPEWASLLRDVQGLEDLARDAQRFVADTPDRNVLATYVVANHLNTTSEAMAGPFERIEACLKADAELRDEANTMRRRVREAEAEMADPVAQFEALTGHSVPNSARDRAASTSEVEATNSSSSGGSSDREDRPQETPVRTVAERISRMAPFTRRAIGTLVVLAMVYAVLFIGSRTTQSTAQRLAAMDVDQTMIEGYELRTRSATSSIDTTDSADALYLEALPLLRDARSTTLGLFPRYDAQKLDRAERLLQEVTGKTPHGSFLHLEATFFLGKIHLAEGNVDQARAEFKTVVERQGRRAQEAYSILSDLQQEYPARPGDVGNA